MVAMRNICRLVVLCAFLSVVGADPTGARPPRLGWYTSGSLSIDSLSDSSLILDTLIGGGYEFLGGVGGNGVTYLAHHAPDIMVTRYTPASWMKNLAGAGGWADSVYESFVAAGVSPWMAWLRLRQADTIQIYPVFSPRFDGFSESRAMANAWTLMDSPGLLRKSSAWTDFTGSGYDGTASITFGVGDTIYFGDIWPNDSLRMALSRAKVGSGTLVVQYYDTSNTWLPVPARMRDIIGAQFGVTTETVSWFEPGPDLRKWKYTKVNGGDYHLLWCRMYWQGSISTAPIITKMRRAMYYNPVGVDSVIIYGWNGALDRDGDGWRDSASAADSAVGALATCDAYSVTLVTRGASGCVPLRYSGMTNSATQDSLSQMIWAQAMRKLCDTSIQAWNGITFDQSPVSGFDLSPVDWQHLQYYGEMDAPYGSNLDSAVARRRNEMVYNFHARVKDSIAASRGATPFIAATASGPWGGNAFYENGRQWFPTELRGYDLGNPRVDKHDPDRYRYAVDMFFMEATSNPGAWDGVFYPGGANRTMLRFPYEIMCSGQRVLGMWAIGYKDGSSEICNDVHRSIYWNYSLAWYYLIRPGNDVDTLYDKRLLYGRYAGVDGNYVVCRGNVSDSRTHDWDSSLVYDLGEPANPTDFTRPYDDLVRDSTWFIWTDTGSVQLYARRYIRGEHANLVLFRMDGEGSLRTPPYSSADSATIGLDTFALDGAYYRLDPLTGDSMSPLGYGGPTPATSVALFSNDGAILIAAGTSTGDFEKPVDSVQYPNGGETFSAGDVDTIRWSSHDNVGTVRATVFFSSDDGSSWSIIATLSSDPQKYIWTVPGTATATARIRVTVYDAAGNSGSDISDAAFTVMDAPQFVAPDPIYPADGGLSLNTSVTLLAANGVDTAGGTMISEFEIADNSAMNKNVQQYLPFSASLSGDTAQAWTVDSLQTNKKYYWRVRGVTASAKTAWSPTVWFQVARKLAATPRKPKGGARVREAKPTLRADLNDSGLYTVYYFQLDEDPAFASPTESGPVDPLDCEACWQVPFELTTGQPYYWRTGVSDADSMVWSAAAMFLGGPEMHAFPNPFRAAEGHNAMTFSGLIAPARLRVATLNGITILDTGEINSDTYDWSVTNQSGQPVASGVYMVRIDDQTGSHDLNVMVIR